MLSQLTITNFGLIDRISMDFTERLNILTGETGAGKSILIDALRIALGDRMHASQVRDPDKPCVIEAAFALTSEEIQALDALEDYLEEDDPTLVIQRRYMPDGKSRIKINGSPVTVGQLKMIGNYLIDFHGPHDHQRLLSSDFHLSMLDRLVGFDDLKNEYNRWYAAYLETRKQIQALEQLAQSSAREIDLLSYQVKELEQISFEESDYQRLQQEQSKIDNTEKLNAAVNELIVWLEGGDNGTSENIRKSFSAMRTLNQIDEGSEPLMETLSQLQQINDQIITDVKLYAQNISFSPESAREINTQMDMYINVLRKYGPSLAEAKAYYEASKAKLDSIENREHNDQELRKELKSIEKQLFGLAQKMSAQRKKTGRNLIKTVEKELKELGIPNVRFDVKFDKTGYGPAGFDQVVFYISPNTGVDLKPLAEIVSSGEAARVMLALKKALIKVDPVDVLIFDEIDAQIGGRLGTVTGQKLKEISQTRQVILITHLPQIACFADAHFQVLKKVRNKRSTTLVAALDQDQRVDEIAKMMSGETKSEIAVEHASAMLSKAAS